MHGTHTNTTDPKPTRHDEKREKRRQMAGRVKAGRTFGEVAQMFGVSLQTVRNACAENGVTVPDGRTTAVRNARDTSPPQAQSEQGGGDASPTNATSVPTSALSQHPADKPVAAHSQ